MSFYDVIFPSCLQHAALEDTETGEGLYGHYDERSFCHVLVSETQIEYLESENIPYWSSSERPDLFKRPASVHPWHTFGSRVRDRLLEPEPEE